MKNNFIGEESVSNQSKQKMRIINWRSTDDIDIQFEDGNIVYHKAHINFKRGEVKNPFFHMYVVLDIMEQIKILYQDIFILNGLIC
jgi:hypothetical protein